MRQEQMINLEGYTVEEAENILQTHKLAAEKRSATFERKRKEREQFLIDNPEEAARIEAERRQRIEARAVRERTIRELAKTNTIVIDGKTYNLDELKSEAGI